MTAAKDVVKDTTARDAAMAEAKDDNIITFDFEQRVYTIDKNKFTDDIDILEAFEDGKIITPIKLMLGDQQWLRFKSTKPNGEKLEAFANALLTAVGVDMGEYDG